MAIIEFNVTFNNGFDNTKESRIQVDCDYGFDESQIEDESRDNADLDDSWNVIDIQACGCPDYPELDPTEFDNPEEFVEFCNKIDDFGEAYRLRADDIGTDFDFEDEYHGCWDSEEEFVQQLIEDYYDLPDFAWRYFDWESATRDFMMDYSSYQGSEGLHIFRDC